MTVRYDIRSDHQSGWTVYDIWTNLPAKVNGVAQIGLEIQDADDLADLLNGLYSEELTSAAY